MESSKAWSGPGIPIGWSGFSGIRNVCRVTLFPRRCSRILFPRRAVLRCRRLESLATGFCFLKSLGGIMISLAGKAALITGGSRGIGAAAVKLFAEAGADVIFSYNSAKEAAKLVEQEAAKHGTRVEAFKADVGKHNDNRKLVEHTIKRL